ncbi:MAG TPA: hypothetical protein VII76_07040 [Acidimicrobiales bacterium]
MATNQTNLAITQQHGYASLAYSCTTTPLNTTLTNANANEVYTAGASGSKIEEIDLVGLSAFTVAGLVVLFIATHATCVDPTPFDFVLVRTVIAMWYRSISSDFGSGSCRYPNLWIASGFAIWATNLNTGNAGLVGVNAFGADF